MLERKPFSDRYVFAKVMQDNPDLCQELIECVLDVRISRIEKIVVEAEVATIVRRSVKFDVFVENSDTAFEVEMQTYEQKKLPMRMRYYRSQLDRLLLNKGADFNELKPVYVIFVCLNDPFGYGLPVYTFRSRCDENLDVPFDNEAVDIVLNASGDLSRTTHRIAELLNYVKTNTVSDEGSFTGRLERAVDDAYKDEEWVRDMSWLDWDIRDAKAAAINEGLAEGHAKGLSEGRAEGREEGRAEGRADGQKSSAQLIEAMERAGCSAEEILAALKDANNLDALYERYGIRDGSEAVAN